MVGAAAPEGGGAAGSPLKRSSQETEMKTAEFMRPSDADLARLGCPCRPSGVYYDWLPITHLLISAPLTTPGERE